MKGQELQEFNDSHIGKILSTSGLSVVLVTASWDGRGIILRSLIQQLSRSHPKVQFCIADFEGSPRIASLFNLSRPPGLLFVKNGELIERILGPANRSQIEELINKFS